MIERSKYLFDCSTRLGGEKNGMYNFNRDFLHLCLEDKVFLEENINLIDQNAFPEEAVRMMLCLIKDLYRDMGTIPSLDIIKFSVYRRFNNEIDIKIINDILDDMDKNPLSEGRKIELKETFMFLGLYTALGKAMNVAREGMVDGFSSKQKLITCVDTFLDKVNDVKTARNNIGSPVTNNKFYDDSDL